MFGLSIAILELGPRRWAAVVFIYSRAASWKQEGHTRGVGSTRVVAHELSGFLPPGGGESMSRTTWLQDWRMQKFRAPRRGPSYTIETAVPLHEPFYAV